MVQLKHSILVSIMLNSYANEYLDVIDSVQYYSLSVHFCKSHYSMVVEQPINVNGVDVHENDEPDEMVMVGDDECAE